MPQPTYISRVVDIRVEDFGWAEVSATMHSSLDAWGPNKGPRVRQDSEGDLELAAPGVVAQATR